MPNISWKPTIPIISIVLYLVTSRYWNIHDSLELKYLIPQLYFCIVIVGMKYFYRISLGDLGFSRENLYRNIFIGLFLGALLCVGLAVVSFIGEYYFSEEVQKNSFSSLWSIYPISLILIAPFVEEIFFRGIFLASLLKRYNVYAAIALGSFIFMGTHGRLHAGALLLGFVTSILYVKTRSVIPGIVLHAIANTSIILVQVYWNNVFQLPFLKYFYR